MRIALKNRKDGFAGLLFILFGSLFAAAATDYRMGTAARMGPGYLPFVLGCLLVILGLAVSIRSLVVEGRDGVVGRLHLRPMLLVMASIGAFALLLEAAGVIVAIVALVVIASLASRELTVKEVVIMSALLLVASLLIFVGGLHLALPLWPAFPDR